MDIILQKFLQSIPYGAFITLTFLLSLVSPIIIGNTIINGNNESKIISKGMAIIFKKTDRLSMVFQFIFRFISNITITLIRRIFKSETKENEKSFLVLINVTGSIMIITSIYYWLSYINLTTVFLGLSKIIKDNLGEGINIKSIIDIVIDNSSLIIPFFKIDGWYFKLFIQIIISILYISIIFHGLRDIEQLNISKIDKKIFNKLSLIKSVTLKNIFITILVSTVSLFIFSFGGQVDEIAFIFLVLNIFNIEISVGTAAIVLSPIVVEKAYTKIVSRRRDPLYDSNIFGSGR